MDVLAPVLDERLIALVESVLEVQQQDHQAYGQATRTCEADADARDHHGRAEQVSAFLRATGVIPYQLSGLSR